MNILITGGAGYIGSHITKWLVKQKTNKVFVLDNLSTGNKKLINKKAFFIKGDIKNFNLLKKIIKGFEIHTIIHLAAFLNISESERKKQTYFKNNILGTKNLILACKNSQVRNFIFSSSCSIYGDQKSFVNEQTKIKPKSYYAYTKHMSEKIIKKFSRKYNISYGIFRYFNVAGADTSGKIGEINSSHGHLIKNISVQSLKKKPIIKIYGNNYPTRDGTPVRDYIHISDLVDIHNKGLKYLEKYNKSFTLNCGYGKGYSVLEIVHISKKYIKNLSFVYDKKRAGDASEIYSDTRKLKKLLKWTPKYNSIKSIIKSSINFEKKFFVKN
jgi:UDP-glucose 4-epimerase